MTSPLAHHDAPGPALGLAPKTSPHASARMPLPAVLQPRDCTGGFCSVCKTWPLPSGQPPQDSPAPEDSGASRHPRPHDHRLPPSRIPHLAAWVLPHPVMQTLHHPPARDCAPIPSPGGFCSVCKTWPLPSGQPPQGTPAPEDSGASRHPRPHDHRLPSSRIPHRAAWVLPHPVTQGTASPTSPPEVSQRIRLFSFPSAPPRPRVSPLRRHPQRTPSMVSCPRSRGSHSARSAAGKNRNEE